ncbi:FAS1 domain-containing protein [Glonium stellatum]|uniref:FAS1 domain-containing protein n=1 Tax=Glonium stellatum TaxID=574774 RepID=A0A8E2EVM6_9PEZI|nr:FAS1 domain-containing protein [Glonium stellatum]
MDKADGARGKRGKRGGRKGQWGPEMEAELFNMGTSSGIGGDDVCKSIGNIQLFCKALGSGAGGGPGPSTHSGSSTSSSTLFAPTDPAGPTRLKALLARQNLLSSQDLYQISPYLIDAAAMRDLTGSTIQTLDNSSTLLNGRSQVVLSHGQRDSANASQALCGAPSPIHLFSGGGDNVTIIKEDVYFDGGVLHVTDNYFTLPDTLSATLSNESDTTIFASYLTNNASLDATPSITVFVPDNAAFLTSTSNQTLSPSAIASLINAYVVEGFVAYSPILTEGLQLRTVSGADVRISTQPDGSIYVNDVAKIIKADIVLENGVAHVIDERPAAGYVADADAVASRLYWRGGLVGAGSDSDTLDERVGMERLPQRCCRGGGIDDRDLLSGRTNVMRWGACQGLNISSVVGGAA